MECVDGPAQSRPGFRSRGYREEEGSGAEKTDVPAQFPCSAWCVVLWLHRHMLGSPNSSGSWKEQLWQLPRYKSWHIVDAQAHTHGIAF